MHKGNAVLEIALSQGKYALIDEEDAALVTQYRWHATRSPNTWYAASYDARVHGRATRDRSRTAVIEQNRLAGARGSQAIVEAVRAEAGPQQKQSAPAPAAYRPGPVVLGTQDWATFKEQAGFFIKSGLLPKSVTTIEAALTIMVTGYELGIGPMQALRLISVVQGKPVCAAELMAALIYRDHGDEALRIEESTAERCALSYKRRGWSERRTYSFSIEDARTAGLAQKDTWSHFPAAMCRARCISAVARMAFPDTISGLYTAEEIAPDRVSVSGEGDEEVLYDAEQQGEPEQTGTRSVPSPAAPLCAPTPSPRATAAGGSTGGSVPATGEGGRPANAAEWTQQQLAAAIREMAGAGVQTLLQWQNMARTYGVPVPARGPDMTQEWLLGLYQAMNARRWEEHIRLATSEQDVTDARAHALSERDKRGINAEQYTRLYDAAEARYAELAGPLSAHAL